jgi:hypothetical protein
MKHPETSLEVALRAFLERTANPGDGRVTRARVLATTARHLRRRRVLRRALRILPAVVLFLSLGTAAWTAALRFRAPPLVTVAADPSEVDAAWVAAASAGTASRPQRSIPAETATPTDGDPWSIESGVYGRAHRAHFVDGDPARALAAWSSYLRRFPGGTFAPEARFNRALCLIRLQRFDESAHALRAFVEPRDEARVEARVEARLPGYRRVDACALLRWLKSRDRGANRDRISDRGCP